MTWYGHKVTTFSIIYAVTGNHTAAIVAGAASILPDMIEFPLRLVLGHRTITHWPYPYLLLLGFLWWGYASSGRIEFWFALLVAAGAFLHLLEDGLSKSGIPFLGPFGPKYGLDFYKVYTLREVSTVAGIALPCLAVSYVLGRFDPAYLGKEVKEMFFISRNLVSWFQI